MFSLFKKKKFKFDCPMCGREYSFKLDPSTVTEFDSPLYYNYSELTTEKCEYCKINMLVLISDNGEIKVVDEKWAKIEDDHYTKLEPIEEEISEIEDKLEEDINNDKLKQKLVQLETKMRKLEDAFEKKEEKYCDRQSNWEEKWQDKLDRM